MGLESVLDLVYGVEAGTGPLDCVWTNGTVFTKTARFLRIPAIFIRDIHNQRDQFPCALTVRLPNLDRATRFGNFSIKCGAAPKVLSRLRKLLFSPVARQYK
jgi:hypothetical protein